MNAALNSIQKQGGGIVEAYPRVSKAGGGSLWFGTVAMFEREGFKPHAKLGANSILMRKSPAQGSPSERK